MKSLTDQNQQIDADPDSDSNFHSVDPDQHPTSSFTPFENTIFFTFNHAIPVYILSSVIGVIIFNILDSILKFSGKKLVCLDEMEKMRTRIHNTALLLSVESSVPG